MKKFEVKEHTTSRFLIVDGELNYMHRDGEIMHLCPEYWFTREQAQTVLDKFQPRHVWKHGDVFRRASGTVMVYLVIYGTGPVVYLLGYSNPGKGMLNTCLADATFLFNIKEKTDETVGG